ncbi:MAG: hypothetical protein R2848_15995 [Thermomicrobiales bacterium]
MTRRRVAVVGLDHYHTTGWVESLELFPDELEIVAIYEPDRLLWEGLAPRYHDPHLAPFCTSGTAPPRSSMIWTRSSRVSSLRLRW